MHVEVTRKNLVKLAQHAHDVADPKSIRPALACAHIAVDSVLSVSGTDLDNCIWATCESTVRSQGSCLVNARDLLERAKAMPDGPLELKVMTNGTLRIKTIGQPRLHSLRALDMTEYPPIATVPENAVWHVLESATLRELIDRTSFSIADDPSRPNLNSGYLVWKDESIYMVSADGYRMSFHELATSGQSANLTALISDKAIKRISKVLVTADKNVGITVAGGRLYIKTADVLIGTQLISAEFPDYTLMLPRQPRSVVTVSRAELKSTVASVSLASDKKLRSGIQLEFRPSTLLVSAESASSGTGSDELPCDHSGKSLKIGVCANYLTDVLTAIESHEVTFHINQNDGLDPLKITPSDGSKSIYIIATMRLDP